MIIYEIWHTVTNRRGRLIFKEVYSLGFCSEEEADRYIKGKWAMADNNESYTMFRSIY